MKTVYALWYNNYDNVPPIAIFENEKLANDYLYLICKENDITPDDFKILPYKLMINLDQAKTDISTDNYF